MFDSDAIKEMLRSRGFSVNEMFLRSELAEEHFPQEINDYLCLMGTSLALNISQHGTAATYLMSQKEICDSFRCEEYLPVINNNCLMIGSGANGDLLCINILTGKIVYVFHDELYEDYEEPDTPIEDISIALDISLDSFIEMAMYDEDYPFDGYTAEEYAQKHKA